MDDPKLLQPVAPPTLKDIAHRCKLSKGSVSRALTMSPEACPLRPQTRRRVLKVAEEMGYFVNAHARALSSGRAHGIGLIYEGSLPILDSVYHSIIESFVEEIRSHRYHLQLIPVDAQSGWLDALHSRRVDGCICLHSLPEEVGLATRRLGLPTVLLNGKSEFATGSVNADDCQGTLLAVEHLLALGHTQIVMSLDTRCELPHYSIAERRDAFLEKMRQVGLGSSAEYITDDPDWEGLLSRLNGAAPPTAVICYSHFEAVPLLRVLQRSRWSVPRDVSVVSFNDVFPVRQMNPALTTVAVPAQQIGKVGAKLMMEQVGGDPDSPRASVCVTLPESLVVMESTGPVSVRT